MTKSNLKGTVVMKPSVIYLMYRQGNREDFCRFKVLKSLVWCIKEVKSSSLRIGHFITIENRLCTV